jgi:multicomponent Na+:H+ antiporter subunit E
MTKNVLTELVYVLMKKDIQLSIVMRGVIFLFTWLILTNGDILSWWIGLPAVMLTTMISIILLPPTHLVFLRVIWFVPLFFIYSFKGALDVAWRVFHPHLPISPGLIKYPLSLPPGVAQVLMTNLVSLVPGTLTAQLEHNVLTIHVLDIQNDFNTQLIEIEQHLEKIFSLPQKTDNEVKNNATI